MRVDVDHNIGDLVADLAAGPTTLKREGRKAVRKAAQSGNAAARRFAREQAGPHGLHYWKRISWEMTGDMSGEFGPHAGGTPVGAGYRNGPGNTDLDRALDVIRGPFHEAVEGILDDIFWPGGG